MSGETTPIYFSTYIGKRFFNKVLKHCRSNWNTYKPEDHMVLYRSPECVGYAELEWPSKYMTICCISFHPCRSITKQIWLCHKNGQGQPSVFIWRNLIVPEYPKRYTKFQDHPLLGSEEDSFSRFLPYMSLEAILAMWPGTFEQIFILISLGGSIRNLASIDPVLF